MTRLIPVRVVVCSFFILGAAISALLAFSQQHTDYYFGLTTATVQENSIVPSNTGNTFDNKLSDKQSRLYNRIKPGREVVLCKHIPAQLHHNDNHFFEDEANTGHITSQNYCHYCPISDIPPPIYPL